MLEGTVEVNQERLVKWQAVRYLKHVTEPVEPHRYDCEVWWFEPGRVDHVAYVEFLVEHRPVLGATSLAATILAKAAIERPDKQHERKS